MKIGQIDRQNFGMALECRPNFAIVKNHIDKCNKLKKSDILIQQLQLNKALTTLTVVNDGNGTKLQAVVGDKIFKENFFNNPYKVIKKAFKESKEQSQIELIADFIKIISKDFD